MGWWGVGEGVGEGEGIVVLVGLGGGSLLDRIQYKGIILISKSMVQKWEVERC